jgi:small-conductance mechanosensitive channel
MTDPLLLRLLATLVLLCAAVIPRAFPGWPPWGKAACRIVIFVILTLLVQRILGSPLRPQFHTEHAGEQFWEQFIEAGWWLIGARGTIGLVRLFIVLESRPREAQIISDLMAGAIYVAALLAIVNFVFAVPIGGLLATSGVIAIVLGLALQSTLSDVFSGIAVGIERPYKPGDLLWVEGGIEGHVIQVNWRSTHIATGQENIAIVPNSIIAKARLVNRSRPTAIRGDTLEIRLDARVPPEQCIAALTAAARSCRLPLPKPSIRINCTGLQGDGAAYEISFSVPSADKLGAARTELFTQIQRHLHHAGIPLAVQGLATVPSITIPTSIELLEQSDLFCVIAPDDRSLIAEHLTETWLQAGETLIRVDDTPQALFIIALGAVEITTNTPTGPHVVHRMGPGESLGAIGLITGSNYVATATALTPVKALRLDKAAIAAAIKIRPSLAAGLEVLAKHGQAALHKDAVASAGSKLEHPEMFLSRLRGFLHAIAIAGVQADAGDLS